ncbi:amino acid permease [Arenimonas fontis]|uniref:Arginine/agmatine antiporter n=1 Tax=Arenimonas fontis TaxID=2608255 RepID=A0A5B2Z9A2_9GAMM|nr:amino acid permease [Arenimonas fontis]KAA2284507.1 amino acid permease [Arenimonas fontis]
MTVRKIGPVLATFVVANNMIGSGFFLLPASLAGQGGVTALSWLLGTVIAVVLGAAFARLARDHPRLDCPDDYVQPALGRDMGFLATSLYWAASWMGNNAIAVAAFGYLVTLLPIDGGDAGWRIAGQLALIWLMFAVNLLGPRKVAAFQSFCVVFGLLPVAAVLVGGWTHFDPGLYSAAWNVTGRPDLAVVLSNLAPVFWAFVGLETGAMVAGIVRDPDRNVPRATLGGILLAGLVYLLSSVLVMGIVPAAELAASSAPFALVAARIFGPWAAAAVAAAAALKATGTLGGWMLVSGESGARAAMRGYLPARFGRMLDNGAAGWGLLFVATAMSVIAILTLAPTVSRQFEIIIGMVVLLVVLAYVAAGLSLLVGAPGRRSGPRERLLGLGALLACGLLIFSSPAWMIGGALAVTLLAWLLFRAFGARPA